jgi:hypothetical protein
MPRTVGYKTDQRLGFPEGPEDLLDCQRRFAQKATEQYAEEITKLAQITARMAQGSFSAFQQPAA